MKDHCSKILLIAETIGNEPLSTIYELIEFANKLNIADSGTIKMVVPGSNVQSLCTNIASGTGVDVIALENEQLLYRNPDILKKGITEIVNEQNADYICFIHTGSSSCIAPQIALETGGSCITAIEALRHTKKRVTFTRSLFSGKIKVEMISTKKRLVCTVLPGAFSSSDAEIVLSDSPGNIEIRQFFPETSRYETQCIIETSADTERLEEADVIISVGRGIGSKDNLSLIKEVSGLFPKSAVGASRPVSDLDWLPYAHQIGTTGKTVSPMLYMACGISGSQQHIAGMRGSRYIVAINRDPMAAIFSIADCCIVEELTAFLPLLVKKYYEMYG